VDVVKTNQTFKQKTSRKNKRRGVAQERTSATSRKEETTSGRMLRVTRAEFSRQDSILKEKKVLNTEKTQKPGNSRSAQKGSAQGTENPLTFMMALRTQATKGVKKRGIKSPQWGGRWKQMNLPFCEPEGEKC